MFFYEERGKFFFFKVWRFFVWGPFFSGREFYLEKSWTIAEKNNIGRKYFPPPLQIFTHIFVVGKKNGENKLYSPFMFVVDKKIYLERGGKVWTKTWEIILLQFFLFEKGVFERKRKGKDLEKKERERETNKKWVRPCGKTDHKKETKPNRNLQRK